MKLELTGGKPLYHGAKDATLIAPGEE